MTFFKFVFPVIVGRTLEFIKKRLLFNYSNNGRYGAIWKWGNTMKKRNNSVYGLKIMTFVVGTNYS